MGLIGFFTIIIVHFIADFICQHNEWAENKKNAYLKGTWKPLLKHTVTYSLVWFFALVIPFGFYTALFFTLNTFILHTITDYITSVVVGRKFDKGHYGSPIPNFGAFTIIGFDQVLHYVQLGLTWYWLIGFAG